MLPAIHLIKGIHPGAILKQEIKNRGLKNKEFAYLINEHAQTIGAILNEQRGINPSLSIKLGKELNVEYDYFMILQAIYDVAKVQTNLQQPAKPNLQNIRRIIFWDTDFDKIDWSKNKRAVIKRIFERGNDTEIIEIVNFYGKETIENEIKCIDSSFLPSYTDNLKRFRFNENI